MAKRKKSQDDSLWGSIKEEDFVNESDNIIDEDLCEYDKESMIYFIQNVNLMRHFPRLADSLKPVERRGLYSLYLDKSFPGTKSLKSNVVIGHTMVFHPHGDMSIYGTLVGMSQTFTNPVPYIAGKGNFGNDENPDGASHSRYTEMTMSKYAQDCFFSDFDDDCIEKIFNTGKDDDEPMVLPSKYPNILVNGGFGIATGNAFCIPPYSIPDIIKLTKRLLKNPDAEDIYILPDIPTGCDVVDNGNLREICDTGTGTLKMRSTITIEENPRKPNIWILRIHNLPWMVSMNSINDRIAKLTKDGVLPIKDVENHSYPIKVKNPNGGYIYKRQIQVDIIISKAHDPYRIRNKLFKLTQLEKPVGVNFKVVTDSLSVKMLNMRGLVLAWINTRREYLRRMINKRITKLVARKALLEILLVLTSKDNLDKTIRIIRSHDEEEIIKALVSNKQIDINSYQAEKIADMKLRAFSKDAHDKYDKEFKKVIKDLDNYMSMTKSSKIIDETIEAQLEDLEKYDTGRRSRIISEEKEVPIPDTDHFICISKLGMVKKLPYHENVMLKKNTPSLGVFKTNDYPVHGLVTNNLDSLMVFDQFGKFSIVPVHTIDSAEPSHYGISAYDAFKLNGEIKDAYQFLSKDMQTFIEDTLNADVYIVTLTKDGYIKKTPIKNFNSTRSGKGMNAMNIRENDELVTGKIILQDKCHRGILIYTEKGVFSYLDMDNIPNQSVVASGLLTMNLEPDDACKGLCVIGEMDEFLLVVTEKGCMKRCELGYLGKPGKRKLSSYLATLDAGDQVTFVDTISGDAEITVCTRTTYNSYNAGDIPIKARKSKCAKMVSLPLGNNIISVRIR